MESNAAEYLQEAHLTLKLDGYLHIVESTSRFKDREAFAKKLGHLDLHLYSSKICGSLRIFMLLELQKL
ncbi:MAG: hypothetical protein ACFFCZ_05540 [Promethearchaeota archaeon]